MNTFELTEENKVFIKKINEMSKDLTDNYDDEVIAWTVGTKISNITNEILQGKSNNLKDIKKLAEDLINNYDDEVIAWDVGDKIVKILSNFK